MDRYEKDMKVRLSINPFGAPGPSQIRTIEQTVRLASMDLGRYGRHAGLNIYSNSQTTFMKRMATTLFLRGRTGQHDFSGTVRDSATPKEIAKIIDAINAVNRQKTIFWDIE